MLFQPELKIDMESCDLNYQLSLKYTEITKARVHTERNKTTI
ncbi:hypothetical protein VIBNIAM115_1530025 [Vibrio nigripulchritudo AM115]|nr:hypothetical protein VIBNIAM115_1530025 [Vibrio nigripulchritudo AM115]